ncbi:MAG: hypothetical protein MK193_11830 [Lentisphaeria bacterium]|nr:hypothetical protein [Lentisphaeria bacterium]
MKKKIYQLLYIPILVIIIGFLSFWYWKIAPEALEAKKRLRELKNIEVKEVIVSPSIQQTSLYNDSFVLSNSADMNNIVLEVSEAQKDEEAPGLIKWTMVLDFIDYSGNSYLKVQVYYSHKEVSYVHLWSDGEIGWDWGQFKAKELGPMIEAIIEKRRLLPTKK